MAEPTELPTLRLSNKTAEKEIPKVFSSLLLDGGQRSRIRTAFLEEMRLGLAVNPERKSSLQMENTFIPELTDGTEHGSYLALDLGGTNFRVVLLTFEDGHIFDEVVDYYEIPEEARFAHGEKLFDVLAAALSDFTRKRNLQDTHFNLGFTFSFPMIHEGVDAGILTSWTKSFNCPGVVGKNVVGLLNEALAKKNDTNITVTCVLNDTTGTIVQGSFRDHRCGIGMILGTGCNACYMEKVANIKKWKGKHTEKEVILDIEWGSFGDNGVLDFLRTEWDDKIDDKSLLPKSFTFEKYIAGKYLGDLVREGLVTLAKKGLFCKKSTSTECLEVHGSLKTKTVATIERENFGGSLSQTKEFLTSWGLDNVTGDDARICQYVCELFSYRSVDLVSVLLSVLLQRMDSPHCTIAIDGSLFEHHPRFKPLMEHLISQYAPAKPFRLMLARDGSGKGAALVAAVVDRLHINDQKTKNGI